MRGRALLSALVLLPALLVVLPAAIAAQGSTAAPWTFTPTPALRPDQHASLALLGRVWGFAKYHHPRFVVDGASADSERRPTQQIGIVPDLDVRPTLAGFRAGRDEVLEAAVSRALGREFRLAP